MLQKMAGKPRLVKGVMALAAPAVILLVAYLAEAPSRNEPAAPSLSDCTATEEPATRLACYDAIAKAPGSSAGRN